jgi:hypothetical protein
MFHVTLFHWETYYLCIMRKRWTPKTEITDTLLKFREKRKWQIALRRYILEKNKSSFYAPFFGLDCIHFRKWIELQFDETLNWDNFSISWQFDHILPLNYFDFSNGNDLRLCWNFINIRAKKTKNGQKKKENDEIWAAKPFFEKLYESTKNPIAKQLLQKINGLENLSNQLIIEQIAFLSTHQFLIQTLSSFDPVDFDQLNSATPLDEILALKQIIKTFGRPD